MRELTKDLLEKKILILGLGDEGISTYTFLRKLAPGKLISLADKLPFESLPEKAKRACSGDDNIEFICGENYLRSLRGHEIIFKSPGIDPFLPEVEEARSQGKLRSNTGIFLDLCKGKIIGVTGTKGKSTTTSLIYEVLRVGGVDTRLIGNIGVPPLSALIGSSPSTTFALELSCHQLLELNRSPNVAVVQNIVPEHLDFYKTFDRYVAAKRNIVLYQDASDYVLYNASYPIPRQFADLSRGVKMPFGVGLDNGLRCSFLNGQVLYSDDGITERIIADTDIPLRGAFNIFNVMPAILVGKMFGLDSGTIKMAIKAFKPLPHRLELVGTCRGVTFYDDSIATVPQATIGAIESFEGRPIILIAGGDEREQDFRELALCITKNNVKKLVLFNPTGIRIIQEIEKVAEKVVKHREYCYVPTMHDAVEAALDGAAEGDVVLLCPAGASHSSFVDFVDRGDQFKAEIHRFCGSNDVQTELGQIN